MASFTGGRDGQLKEEVRLNDLIILYFFVLLML